jgi:hypothetical protein
MGCHPDRADQDKAGWPGWQGCGDMVVTAPASPIGPVPKRRRGPKAVEVPVPLETAEQTAFVQWFRLQFPGVLIFSIPNGAHLAGTIAQRAAQVARLKAEGMVSGVPDLEIPAWNLYIEMKRQRGGKLSVEQRQIHDALRRCGKTVIVAKGWEHAADQVRALTRPVAA